MKSLQRSRIILVLIALAAIATALFSLWTRYAAIPGDNNPVAPPVTDQRSHVQEYIDTLTLEEKIAGLLILHTPSTNPDKLARFMEKHQTAGLILMDDNIPPTLREMSNLTTSIQNAAPANYPALIAIDQEGCSVKRLTTDTFPCAPTLGQQSPDATEQTFAQRSQLLERVGINLNFGIVADTTSNPESFIYPRVFGDDPQAVSTRVEAAVKGSTQHTLTTIKHFPGHGATIADSHSSIPTISLSKQQWLHREALPFEAGINSGVDVVMFGHLAYTHVDKRPATLSPAWHDIARDELGFEGLIITDDLLMLQQSGVSRYQKPADNAVFALQAGSTLLLFVNNHGSGETHIDISGLVAKIAKAVEDERLSEDTIDENLKQVLTVRKELRSTQ